MLLRLLWTLRLKRVWIPLLGLTGLAAGGWTWASSYFGPIDPASLPFTPGTPSSASRHAAPNYGTLVRFEPSPADAFARARQEGKLVLLLHLSGNFDSSETT